MLNELREFCYLVGIPVKGNSKIEDLVHIKKVEMIMDRLPAPIENLIIYLPSLTELCLVHVGLGPEMPNMRFLPQLQFLNLKENKIQTIGHGLHSNAQLTKLFLCGNRIDSFIPRSDLRGLKKLEVFWCSCNTLQSLQNFDVLRNLKELNVAGNRIERVAFEDVKSLKSLQRMNLAANSIMTFDDILEMSKIPCLKELHLMDPDFGENPLCGLCNYRVAITKYFKHLEMVDLLVVDKRMIEKSEATWRKKRIYYQMRFEVLRRQSGNTFNIGREFFRKAHAKLTAEYVEIKRKMGYYPQYECDSMSTTSLVSTTASSASEAPRTVMESRSQSDETQQNGLTSGGTHSESYEKLKRNLLKKKRLLQQLRSLWLLFCKKLAHLKHKQLKSIERELNSAGNIHFELPLMESAGPVAVGITRELAWQRMHSDYAFEGVLPRSSHEWERVSQQLIHISWVEFARDTFDKPDANNVDSWLKAAASRCGTATGGSRSNRQNNSNGGALGNSGSMASLAHNSSTASMSGINLDIPSMNENDNDTRPHTALNLPKRGIPTGRASSKDTIKLEDTTTMDESTSLMLQGIERVKAVRVCKIHNHFQVHGSDGPQPLETRQYFTIEGLSRKGQAFGRKLEEEQSNGGDDLDGVNKYLFFVRNPKLDIDLHETVANWRVCDSTGTLSKGSGAPAGAAVKASNNDTAAVNAAVPSNAASAVVSGGNSSGVTAAAAAVSTSETEKPPSVSPAKGEPRNVDNSIGSELFRRQRERLLQIVNDVRIDMPKQRTKAAERSELLSRLIEELGNVSVVPVAGGGENGSSHPPQQDETAEKAAWFEEQTCNLLLGMDFDGLVQELTAVLPQGMEFDDEVGESMFTDELVKLRVKRARKNRLTAIQLLQEEEAADERSDAGSDAFDSDFDVNSEDADNRETTPKSRNSTDGNSPTKKKDTESIADKIEDKIEFLVTSGLNSPSKKDNSDNNSPSRKDPSAFKKDNSSLKAEFGTPSNSTRQLTNKEKKAVEEKRKHDMIHEWGTEVSSKLQTAVVESLNKDSIKSFKERLQSQKSNPETANKGKFCVFLTNSISIALYPIIYDFMQSDTGKMLIEDYKKQKAEGEDPLMNPLKFIGGCELLICQAFNMQREVPEVCEAPVELQRGENFMKKYHRIIRNSKFGSTGSGLRSMFQSRRMPGLIQDRSGVWRFNKLQRPASPRNKFTSSSSTHSIDAILRANRTVWPQFATDLQEVAKTLNTFQLTLERPLRSTKGKETVGGAPNTGRSNAKASGAVANPANSGSPSKDKTGQSKIPTPTEANVTDYRLKSLTPSSNRKVSDVNITAYERNRAIAESTKGHVPLQPEKSMSEIDLKAQQDCALDFVRSWPLWEFLDEPGSHDSAIRFRTLYDDQRQKVWRFRDYKQCIPTYLVSVEFIYDFDTEEIQIVNVLEKESIESTSKNGMDGRTSASDIRNTADNSAAGADGSKPHGNIVLIEKATGTSSQKLTETIERQMLSGNAYSTTEANDTHPRVRHDHLTKLGRILTKSEETGGLSQEAAAIVSVLDAGTSGYGGAQKMHNHIQGTSCALLNESERYRKAIENCDEDASVWSDQVLKGVLQARLENVAGQGVSNLLPSELPTKEYPASTTVVAEPVPDAKTLKSSISPKKVGADNVSQLSSLLANIGKMKEMPETAKESDSNILVSSSSMLGASNNTANNNALRPTTRARGAAGNRSKSGVIVGLAQDTEHSNIIMEFGPFWFSLREFVFFSESALHVERNGSLTSGSTLGKGRLSKALTNAPHRSPADGDDFMDAPSSPFDRGMIEGPAISSDEESPQDDLIAQSSMNMDARMRKHSKVNEQMDLSKEYKEKHIRKLHYRRQPLSVETIWGAQSTQSVNPHLGGHRASSAELFRKSTERKLFTSATFINLHNGGLRRLAPNCFEKLKSLKHLNLSFNLFENETDIARSDSLEMLDLGFNRFKHIDMCEIFPSLRTFNLEGNQIATRKDIKNLPYGLKVLNLEHNPISSDVVNGQTLGKIIHRLIELSDMETTSALLDSSYGSSYYNPHQVTRSNGIVAKLSGNQGDAFEKKLFTGLFRDFPQLQVVNSCNREDIVLGDDADSSTDSSTANEESDAAKGKDTTASETEAGVTHNDSETHSEKEKCTSSKKPLPELKGSPIRMRNLGGSYQVGGSSPSRVDNTSLDALDLRKILLYGSSSSYKKLSCDYFTSGSTLSGIAGNPVSPDRRHSTVSVDDVNAASNNVPSNGTDKETKQDRKLLRQYLLSIIGADLDRDEYKNGLDMLDPGVHLMKECHIQCGEGSPDRRFSPDRKDCLSPDRKDGLSAHRRNAGGSPHRQNRPQRGLTTFFYHNLKTLNLSYLGLKSLNFLEYFCTPHALQELDLQHNKLEHLDGPVVEQFCRLKRLHLGSNYLKDLHWLMHCANLEFLSAENNLLNALDCFYYYQKSDLMSIPLLGSNNLGGMSGFCLTHLVELYLGNNLLEDLRSVILLSRLPKLAILDLSGNKLCQNIEVPVALKKQANTQNGNGTNTLAGSMVGGSNLAQQIAKPVPQQNFVSKRDAPKETYRFFESNYQLSEKEGNNSGASDSINSAMDAINGAITAFNGDSLMSTMEGAGTIVDTTDTNTMSETEENTVSSAADRAKTADADGKTEEAAVVEDDNVENPKTKVQNFFTISNDPILPQGQQISQTYQRYRLYVIFYLRKLKYLDGLPVSDEEIQRARQMFFGCLSIEFIENFLKHSPGSYGFSCVRTLDLSNCRLSDLGATNYVLNNNYFPVLRVLTVDGNPIKRAIIGPLDKLIVLKMNRCRLGNLARFRNWSDDLLPMRVNANSIVEGGVANTAQTAHKTDELTKESSVLSSSITVSTSIIANNNPDNLICLFPLKKLQVVELSYNNLKSAWPLSNIKTFHNIRILAMAFNRLSSLTEGLQQYRYDPGLRDQGIMNATHSGMRGGGSSSSYLLLQSAHTQVLEPDLELYGDEHQIEEMSRLHMSPWRKSDSEIKEIQVEKSYDDMTNDPLVRDTHGDGFFTTSHDGVDKSDLSNGGPGGPDNTGQNGGPNGDNHLNALIAPFYQFRRLKALILSHNKIRHVDDKNFWGLVSLRELHMSYNRVQRLSPFRHIPKLRTLLLDFNRINSLEEFGLLRPKRTYFTNSPKKGDSPKSKRGKFKERKVEEILPSPLLEISFARNPVAKKPFYRFTLCKRLEAVETIDGKEVSQEDRLGYSIKNTAGVIQSAMTGVCSAQRSSSQSALVGVKKTLPIIQEPVHPDSRIDAFLGAKRKSPLKGTTRTKR